MKFTGVHKKNKHHVVYPDIPSARNPVTHGSEIPVSSVPKDIDIAEDSVTELEDMDTSTSYQPPIPDKNKPVTLSQAQLNDLTRIKRVCPATWITPCWKQFTCIRSYMFLVS